ncbi:MAG: RnfABCDGE type electron transport complex subunit D [Lachnospiraceae bacterium]|nr:RnfABCDGE type electron transport complex subunit D [Lachnospiraceae bacterium]
MNERYQVSVSPHVRDNITTQKIMLAVIIALMPSCIFGIINFGLHALLILVITPAAAVLSEYAYEKLLHKKVTVGDLSALLTGLLLGMNMPPEIAWWIPVLGAVFAIVVIKQLYGGLGSNFMNPALGARCFLIIAFSGQMTTYTSNGGFINKVWDVPATTDALSQATPLAYLKLGEHFDLTSLFLGNVGGVIGETSALCLLIGGLFLVFIKVIEIRIPAVYIGTFAVLTVITAAFRGYNDPFIFMLEELCAGGLMLGVWFMATDYVTSPITPKAQYVYALLLGVLTWIFRLIGKSAEGVSYAIIFMNCLVPLIENYTKPLAFGIVKEKKSDKVKEGEKA